MNEWVIVVYRQFSNFLAISWQEQVRLIYSMHCKKFNVDALFQNLIDG
jgi:hypothetical protein